jgi:hypothetical protein
LTDDGPQPSCWLLLLPLLLLLLKPYQERAEEPRHLTGALHDQIVHLQQFQP